MPNTEAECHQGLQFAERKDRGGVRTRLIRPIMHLEEQGVGARRDAGPRQKRHMAPVPARSIALAAGELAGVCGIEHHRGEFLHDGNAGQVVDEPAIAEECAALGNQNALVSGFANR